ncbi:MAG: DUF3459 domain-containing protein, partial [Actinomycetota bacterium]|nr:DUF3459 domain-containing protein [Actinomycetota bacterium]
LLMGLPGTPFLFQGEELGLTNGVVPREQAQDPVARRTEAVGRDGARTPLPWAPGPGWGFTDGPQTWLPMEGRTEADTVAVQRADPSSMLHRYRALIALRDALPDLRRQPVEWVGEDGPVVAYRRGDVIVAANCGDQAWSFTPLDGPWVVAFSSNADAEGQPAEGEVELAPHQAVVLTA